MEGLIPPKGGNAMENILLLITLLVCLITDLKYMKIYNFILIPALIIGVLLNFYYHGRQGLFDSFMGFTLGFIILIIPFIFGGIGAGDVKLLAVIGAIKGPSFIYYAALAMGVAGGIISIVALIYQKRLIIALKKIREGFWLMVLTRFKVISFNFDYNAKKFPYGVAITTGAFITFLIMG